MEPNRKFQFFAQLRTDTFLRNFCVSIAGTFPLLVFKWCTVSVLLLLITDLNLILFHRDGEQKRYCVSVLFHKRGWKRSLHCITFTFITVISALN